MYFDNEVTVSTCIEDLTREIWSVIRKVLTKTASEDDIKGAAEKANYLRLYINTYESKRYRSLNESSVWLAKEVVEAVIDLIDF
ncbi:hypothetical protein SEA_LILMARTIN_226 [Streptomyces phage LilMartin]|nr:hypothetical protein SEA_LILMARTIN_226 [Streptomyces phage LilMartin]QNO12614.1 hypothetical protein SEA_MULCHMANSION_230 [Streptomyces phage MulchMansion]UVK61282.1 hypothetical protein SEA_ANGELA_230 [Streptomyces phage Angela]